MGYDMPDGLDSTLCGLVKFVTGNLVPATVS